MTHAKFRSRSLINLSDVEEAKPFQNIFNLRFIHIITSRLASGN